MGYSTPPAPPTTVCGNPLCHTYLSIKDCRDGLYCHRCGLLCKVLMGDGKVLKRIGCGSVNKRRPPPPPPPKKTTNLLTVGTPPTLDIILKTTSHLTMAEANSLRRAWRQCSERHITVIEEQPKKLVVVEDRPLVEPSRRK